MGGSSLKTDKNSIVSCLNFAILGRMKNVFHTLTVSSFVIFAALSQVQAHAEDGVIVGRCQLILEDVKPSGEARVVSLELIEKQGQLEVRGVDQSVDCTDRTSENKTQLISNRVQLIEQETSEAGLEVTGLKIEGLKLNGAVSKTQIEISVVKESKRSIAQGQVEVQVQARLTGEDEELRASRSTSSCSLNQKLADLF